MKRTFLAGLMVMLAACSGAETVTGPEADHRGSRGTLGMLMECRVTGEVGVCTTPAPTGGFGDVILAPPRVQVLISNVVRDTAHQWTFMDVSAKNMMADTLLGSDGVANDGFDIFLHDDPAVTVGSGVAYIMNNLGADTFTGSGQPYFHYPQVLAPGQTSASQNWWFEWSPGVEEFTFTVFVSGDIVPT